jgi:hypothetical protein
MRIATVLTAAMLTGSALATLPPPTEEAKAQAAVAAAKSAWTDKIAQYQLCVAMDKTAEKYRSGLKAAQKNIPAPTATAPCADPGPYVAAVTPAASKPLEAAGAHSPPGAATSPPSGKATAAEIAGGVKK